jgi:hypothetical protein
VIQTEWFWIKKDPDAPSISDAAGFNRKNYPYFTDAESFSKVDDQVAYYEYGGNFLECDFLFEPTFLIHDNLQSLFKFIEPNLEFKGVQLYAAKNSKTSATPLYWLPYLEFTDAISENSKIIQGKPLKLIFKAESIGEKRLIHCKLPAADIWALSLEAAECLLRRQPVGILLEKIPIQQ